MAADIGHEVCAIAQLQSGQEVLLTLHNLLSASCGNACHGVLHQHSFAFANLLHTLTSPMSPTVDFKLQNEAVRNMALTCS